VLHTLLLASVLALAGVPASSNDPVQAETTIELVLSDDDTVSGTATFRRALDEGRWDTDRFGPPNDAAPNYEHPTDDLDRLDTQLAGHTGVAVERAERGDDPFGDSGVTVRFDTVPFDQFNAVIALLHDGGHVGTVVTVSRQIGPGDHTPEGGGPHHRVEGEVDPPPLEVRPDLDHAVSVSATFAGPVYVDDGDLDGRTVTWTDEGPMEAIAVTDEEGTWLWWFLLALVVVLSAWRYAQQGGSRRDREQRGEIPPPKPEIEGFRPIYHR
jgi:hypothetical protein